MKAFRHIIHRNMSAVVTTVVINILASMAMVYAGYSLSFLFDSYENDGNRVSVLLYTCIKVFGIWAAALIIYYFDRIIQANALRKLKNNLRQHISSKIVSTDYEEFVSKDTGHYVSWLTNDTENIAEQSFSTIFSLITNFSTALFAAVALFSINTYVGGIAVILFFFVSVLPQFVSKSLQKANKTRSAVQEASLEGFKDSVTGFPVLLMANLLDALTKRIEKYSQDIENANFAYAKRSAGVRVFITTTSVIGQIILLAVTILTAIHGTTQIGATLSVGNLAGSFFNAIGGVAQGFTLLKSSHVLWDKFDVTQEPKSSTRIKNLRVITLDNVGFCYGEKQVLQIDAMQFCKHGKYALLGESGSGKTTLVKLISGLLNNYSGSIRYNDTELSQIARSDVFNKIAYVDQKVFLFQDTIRYNITLGLHYPEERIIDVVNRCCLNSYISALPQGLDTLIAEDGKDLSGGQRQRIALARALIRNVDLVILDEGTAALDDANALDIELSLVDDPSIGVIIVTHNLRDSVRARLDEVYVIPGI